MKNTIICLLLFVVMLHKTQAQELFNVRYGGHYVNLIFSSLELTDSAYYVTGVVLDTNPTHQGYAIVGAAFCKFDTSGNILFAKEILGGSESHEPWEPTLVTTPEGNLLTCAHYFNWTDTTQEAMMCAMTMCFTTQGDTLWTRKYCMNPGDFFRAEDMVLMDNKDVALTISRQIGSGFVSAILLVTDSMGNEKWRKTVFTPSYFNSFGSITKDNEGNFLWGYHRYNVINEGEEYCLLHKLTPQGDTIWTYQSPANQIIGGTDDIELSTDGGWIMASNWGYDTPWGVLYDGYVFKVDSVGNFVWGTKLASGAYSALLGRRTVKELSNGNIVLASSGWESTPNGNIETIWINILSPEGDSLWSKDYYIDGVTLDTNQIPSHWVYDMEITSSGYFVLCGEVVDVHFYPEPIQQGWLLKVGIPTDITAIQKIQDEVQENGFYMRLYPNPAQDYTIIDFSTALGEQENYRIFISNAQGQVLRDIPVQSANSGYIVDVAGLAAGVYYVGVLRGGQVLRTEKLVKQ